MENVTKLTGCILGNVVSFLSLQDIDSITGIIFAIVGCCITIISGVIIPLIKYFKGKINEDELKKELEETKEEIEKKDNEK